MVKAKFSMKMIENLAKLKNSVFLRYIIDNETNGVSSYCKVGLDSDAIRLDLLNEEIGVDCFDSDENIKKEDITVFSCKIRKNGESFKPYLENSEVISVPINETIKAIYVVSDIIDVNRGEYCIDYDMAVIIETSEHKYIFSRGWFFCEEIYITVDKDINDIYSVQDVKKSWNNDGEFIVKVDRVITEIEEVSKKRI